MTAVVLTFIDLFVAAFNLLLLARVIMSWVRGPWTQGAFGQAIINLTDPVLAPIKAVLPKSQMIDLSPLIAFFALQLLQTAVHSWLR